MDKEKNESTSETPSAARRIQNFLLVWLDGNIDEVQNKECINIIAKLREVANNVYTFTDVDKGVDFFSNIEEEKVFLIISEIFGQRIVPLIHDTSQINDIYIFCDKSSRDKQWVHEWSKVKGVFTEIAPMCNALKTDVRRCDQNSVSMSFVAPIEGSTEKPLDELDQSFMYTQVLKEILLTIDFEQDHIDQFIQYCQEQLAGNNQELATMDEIKREYRKHCPIWWYTRPTYLYSMLNRALRLMEVDLIVRMGFFIRDLHQNIVALHAKQYGVHDYSTTFIVYRGQGLSQSDFDQLMRNKGGLLSFNTFLSTSLDPDVSRSFAQSNADDPELIGIFFQITVNPSATFAPFANIKDVSYFQTEDEILFSMHSIFRIGEIKPIDDNNHLWKVNLTLTTDNDPQLQALTECIQRETFPDQNGWYRLGNLLHRLGRFNQAQEVFEIMLAQNVNDFEKAKIHGTLGVIKEAQGKYEEAIAAFNISHKVFQTTSSNAQTLASSYSNRGAIYSRMGDYSNALSSLEKALEIRHTTLPPNHPSFAAPYNNIGLVHERKGDYLKAFLFYEKVLEIQQKTLPLNHPHLAVSYNSIGSMYGKMGNRSKALQSLEKALEIQHKTLPPNHPHLAVSYGNISSLYGEMGDYSKALLSHEKALEIWQEGLPSDHSNLAASYNNIGLVYGEMGNHSKALSSHEKALEIWQKALPPDHPDLATSYNNIGLVYERMGNHSKALSLHEKALEIWQEALPPNHPHLAASYKNIGSMYMMMGDHSKARQPLEKALEIWQKTLPPDHPDLANCYNDIGLVYEKMGDHFKALQSLEKALEIWQKTLPPDHPLLAISYDHIGSVYRKMGDHFKALSSHEQALEIWQKTLPPDHPHLANSYSHIGGIFIETGDDSKALSFFELALDVGKRSLPANHPNLESIKQSIEIVQRKLLLNTTSSEVNRL